MELAVTGEIPGWAAGVLYRTGIGPNEVETEQNKPFKVNHWFDALAVVHRFQILAPDKDHPSVRVIYNSRSTCDKLIENVKKTGKADYITFARKYDPCATFFQKAMSVFHSPSSAVGKSPDDVSMSVTLSVNFPGLNSKAQKKTSGHASGIQTLCNKTDNSMLQMLDPETLEPTGVADQSVLHPDLKGPLSAAHSRSDPVTGDVYNYNLDFGRTATYRVFQVSASTGETTVLAKIPGADPAYIHSFFMTENYLILCVWNSFFSAAGVKILWHRNIVDALQDYDASRPARWYVIDRRTPANGGQGVVAAYESQDFYCFHTVNAYEVPSSSGSGTDIVADLVAYNNLDILKRFYLDNVVSTSKSAAEWTANTPYNYAYKRFRLPSIPDKPVSSSGSNPRAKLEFQSEPADAPELPTLNPRCVTRPHRYVYGVTATGKSTFLDGLVKFDTQTREATHWIAHAQNAGEPIFVPRPRQEEEEEGDDEPDEDDGVLLSVVLDGLVGKSYLLVLDAKTMTEVARAHANGPIGFGLHGTHVSALKGQSRLEY